ncbi:hypothetical protein CHS0354_006223 [Potamilus streckersoni]|uniref:Uncharacterized protein n=1 Tax=Potamilus streckersoni TaxID=2493646 RepID=A0AAE0VPV9_9BIVA|nr:hypothetical protein CHS0354_006223 [Potamilus streckersoni]
MNFDMKFNVYVTIDGIPKHIYGQSRRRQNPINNSKGVYQRHDDAIYRYWYLHQHLFDTVSDMKATEEHVLHWIEEDYVNTHGSGAPDTSVTIPAASTLKPSLIPVNSAEDNTEIVQEQSQNVRKLSSETLSRIPNPI